jgi:hypothetical protein
MVLIARLLIASCAGICLALCHATASWGDDPSKFTAAWADGSRTGGDQVTEWHDPAAQPKLNGQSLFDANRPIRWLRYNVVETAPLPRMMVEMAGGDRLPGKVVGYQRAADVPYDSTPGHLLVEPDLGLDWPDIAPRQRLRILTEWLRRIVWEQRSADSNQSARYQPGTIFFRDGRQVAYRSLRWLETGVRVLLEEGTHDVPFGEMAELHLPAISPWESYLGQLSVLTPDGTARLMRIEAAGGLQVTTSTERFQARSHGTASDPKNWVHAIQPAWSLDTLYVRHLSIPMSIRMRQFFAPHELPLTWLEPSRSQQRSALGGGWRWQVDRNVQGGLLRSGNEDYGWGLGVQAYSEIEYPLSPLVRTLRTRIGLDETAGSGGCVRCRIFAGSPEASQLLKQKPLFESPLIIGSAQVIDTGPLDLQAVAKAKGRVVLTVDTAHNERPPGADPLDIRDTLDWLEPLLELDQDALRVEIRRRALARMTVWDDWKIESNSGDKLRLANRVLTADAGTLNFRSDALPTDGPLVLSKQVRIAPGQQLLCLNVMQPGDVKSKAMLEVRAGDESLLKVEVPRATNLRSPPDPLFVPLYKFRGQDIQLRLEQTSPDDKAWVRWNDIGFLPRRPTILRIFEDEANFVSQLTEGDGSATFVSDPQKARLGTGSLQLVGARGNPRLEGLDVAISDAPRIGEFRFIHFALRKRGGGAIRIRLAHDGKYGPKENAVSPTYGYNAGEDRLRVGKDVVVIYKLSDNWQAFTRDLFGDFGRFRLTGFSLESLGGEYAEIDQIYLARRLEEFQLLPEELKAGSLAP